MNHVSSLDEICSICCMNIHIQIHTYKAHIRAKLAEIQTFLGDCFLPRLSHAARRDLSSHVSVRP